MLAIGNEELGDPLGSEIKCKRCGQMHPVEYGDEVLPDGTKRKSDLLAFYRCGRNSYLCGINGRELP